MSEHLDATDDQGSRPSRRWRRRVLLVLIPAVATAVIFACGLFAGRELGQPDESGQGTASAPREPTQTVTVTAAPTPKPSPPTRLIVKSLDIDAPVVDIDLGTDAVLEPPEDPDLVGFWTGSAKVGATKGRTVITGHTVQDGDGALDELPDLKPGATVQLANYSGMHSYRVTDNLYVTYKEVAKHAQDIFGQTEKSPDGARLILVTCTEFNGRFYEGNSIVVAEPIPPKSAENTTTSPSATP
jgi:LPXTG-site transpeptidase (sortase) family protein